MDLRHNTGGNMWPTPAGLNLLIKDGVAGYWVYPGGKKSEYKDKIMPDVLTATNNTTHNDTIDAAKKWLSH